MAARPEFDELVIGGGGEIYALWLPCRPSADKPDSRPVWLRYVLSKWDPQEWICRKQSEEDGFLLEEWDRTKL
ncbi:MAG: hypothetical protein ACLSFJ_03245 [Holdemania filiformis]